LLISRINIFHKAQRSHRKWPSSLSDKIIDLSAQEFTQDFRRKLAAKHCSLGLPGIDTKVIEEDQSILTHQCWWPRGYTEGLSRIVKSHRTGQQIGHKEAQTIIKYLNNMEGEMQQEYSFLEQRDRIYLFSVYLSPMDVASLWSRYLSEYNHQNLSEVDFRNIEEVHEGTFVHNQAMKNPSITEFIVTQMRTSSCKDRLWNIIENIEQILQFEQVWPLDKDKFLKAWKLFSSEVEMHLSIDEIGVQLK